MTNLEYSDYYKFLSSVGVVLLGLALLLPWLLLREPLDISLTVAEIGKLTPVAQQLVAVRQYTALFAIKYVFVASGSLAVLGLGLLIFGLESWRGKQKTLDQKELLETEKLRLEVGKMTPEEIANKAIKETMEEQGRDNQTSSNPPHSSSIVREYFRIEDVVLRKLNNCFGQEKVLRNRKIYGEEYDAILLSDTPKTHDIIFEIKASRHAFGHSKIIDVKNHIVQKITKYTEATNRQTKGVGLLVQLENSSTDTKANNQQHLKTQNSLSNLNGETQIFYLSETELANLDCERLTKMLSR